MSRAAVRNDARNDGRPDFGTCPLCSRRFPIQGRSIYCGPVCRQRAFRLRQPHRPTLTELATRLRQQQRLVAQTIYECPACQARLRGTRRCPDCNLMCSKLGLGGECGGCAELVTISELLGLDLEGGDAPT